MKVSFFGSQTFIAKIEIVLPEMLSFFKCCFDLQICFNFLSSSSSDSPLCPRSASASPLTLCAHQPHHRCADRWRVTSSTPDITQRQHRRSSTPVCLPN